MKIQEHPHTAANLPNQSRKSTPAKGLVMSITFVNVRKKLMSHTLDNPTIFWTLKRV